MEKAIALDNAKDGGRRNAPARYDLHLHTFWSYDASLEPEAHFRRARELGLRVIAITEHHQMDSAAEVSRLAEQYPEIRVIPAAELTVNTSIGPVDLLCYGLPREPSGTLGQILEEYHEWQRATGAARSRGMQSLGYDYGEAERREVLLSYRPQRVLDRQGVTHVAAGKEVEYFIRRGWIASREELPTLRQRISDEFVRPLYPAVERVVPAVKEAGGLVVIAHPAGYFRRNDLQRIETLREECALDGIECAHRIVHPELTAFYRDYCRRNDLLSTAGSDSHHPEDLLPPEHWGYTPERTFASHLGEEAWLDELLERLPC